MLLSFRMENHKSVRDEQQLLLTPAYEDARPENADWEASTVAGVFGANASGKSNVLDALVYMRHTVRWSMNNSEPGGGVARTPFALSAEARSEPSTYVVDLMIDGVRHTYGFAVDDTEVVEEWLYRYPKRRKRVVFERDEDGFSFGEENRSKLRQVEQLTGANVLFLTVAARTGSDEVAPVYRWFSEALVFAEERRAEAPWWLRGDDVPEKHLERLSALLSSADTGVHSVELQTPDQIEEESSSRVEDHFQNLPAALKGLPSEALGEKRQVHSVKRVFRSSVPMLTFRHGVDEDVRPLRWNEESRGTKALATLGYQAQRALDSGGVLVVDEIDASLHPYLSARIISLFRDETENPHGAQLLFTSHDAALLGRIRGEEVLKRDHIWFVDKGEQGRTELYPLSDFKPRGDDNRSRRYLTGRYGAVPDVDDEFFREALSRREPEATPQ